MTHPQFKWTGDESADRYEIQIAGDSGFLSIQQSDSIPVPRYIPLEPVPAGGEYWWRVRAQYANGSVGKWSSSREITIADGQPVYQVYSTNSLSEITDTIAAAASNTPSKLLFEVGTYNLNLPNDQHLFQLTGVRDLYIDGNLCQINLQNSASGFSYFSSCEDILLRRFNVDYVTNGIPVTHTAGIVESVNTNNASFVFELLSGYLPPTDPRIRDASSRRWGCLMDTNTPGRLKFNVNNWLDCKTQIDDLGSNQYRIYLTDAQAGRISNFDPGDTFVKNASYAKYVMFSIFCKNITYEQIISYGGSGNHFIGHWNDNIAFLRCQSLLKPGRFQSNPCGGYVGTGYRTGFWIENCLTEGLFDDVVNCNNQPVHIWEVLGTNVFTAYQIYPAPLLTVGEHLTLYNPPTGRLGGTFEITALEWLPDEVHWKVTVNGDLGEVFPGSENWNSQLYIRERSHQNVYIRNNTFLNSRGRCLLRAHDGVIEGNTFIGLSEQAILARNDSHSGDEGLGAIHIRILNNTISNCGISSLFFGQHHGEIEFAVDAYNTNSTERLHGDIEISGNTILDWNSKGICIINARDAVIQSNVISNLNSSVFLGTGSDYPVYLENSDNIILTNNDLRDTRPVDASVFVINCTGTVVRGNLLSSDVVCSNSVCGE
jgi:hypothetical protein